MASEPTSRPLTAALLARARASEALRSALRIGAVSRAGILLVAIYAALTLGPGDGGLGERNQARFDSPALTHPLGGGGDVLLSPLARWDSVWYLTIADEGYGDPAGDGAGPRAAFFPLYPLTVRAGGELLGGGRGGRLVAAYLASLAAFLAALYLLSRLVALELGRRLAAPTLLLLAVFPGALFFGAPYSESLYLLLSIGAIYAARTGHWAAAGAAAAGAAATRSAGILLLVPLAILYLWGPREDRPRPASALLGRGWRDQLRPRHRPGLDAAWLLLAPLGLAAYALYLGVAHGEPFAFLDVQAAWYREFAGPFVGVWDGAVAALDGARQLGSGSREHVYFEVAAGDPFRIAAINLMLFATLAFALAAAVGVLRRLPFAYGAYVVAALALPLSFPVEPQPLMSLPRFVAVLFPIFMWLALWADERRATPAVAAVSAVGLGLLTAEFAAWRFVA
jgi:hypothetical protein